MLHTLHTHYTVNSRALVSELRSASTKRSIPTQTQTHTHTDDQRRVSEFGYMYARVCLRLRRSEEPAGEWERGSGRVKISSSTGMIYGRNVYICPMYTRVERRGARDVYVCVFFSFSGPVPLCVLRCVCCYSCYFCEGADHPYTWASCSPAWPLSKFNACVRPSRKGERDGFICVTRLSAYPANPAGDAAQKQKCARWWIYMLHFKWPGNSWNGFGSRLCSSGRIRVWRFVERGGWFTVSLVYDYAHAYVSSRSHIRSQCPYVEASSALFIFIPFSIDPVVRPKAALSETHGG